MKHKAIEVGNQKRLGMVRCVQLALTSMRYRALRSTVTLSTLALAVAFLMISGADTMVTVRVRGYASMELGPDREAKRSLARLRTPDGDAEVVRSLQRGDAAMLSEYHQWVGGDAAASARLEEATSAAVHLMVWQEWAEGLSAGARASLLSGQSVMQNLERWSHAAAWDRLLERLGQWGYGLPGDDAEAAKAFAEQGWPSLQSTLEAIEAGHRTAVDRLEAWSDFETEEAKRAAADAGFVISPSRWEAMAEVSRLAAVRRQINEALRDPVVRTRVGRRLNMKVNAVGLEAVLSAVQDDATGGAVASVMREAGFDVADDALNAVASGFQRDAALMSVLDEADPAEALAEAASAGLPVQMWILLGLSLLVCVVGVSNAMLMAVTDRFREIATMKCIGALDGSIMGLFVIESLCLGVMASVVGVGLGVVLALGRAVLALGGLLWETPGLWTGLATAAGWSALAGLVLAVVAAVGPAWAAARLAPMEAMRVS